MSSTMVYSWGRQSYAINPQVVGETVERIADDEGVCTPGRLVEEARDEQSTLHPLFTWPDDAAAEKWRAHEARNVMNSLTVTVVSEGKSLRGPAFISVGHTRQAGISGEGYRPVRVVLANDVLAQEALQDALSRMRAIRQRYAHLAALAEVWQALDRVEAA